MNFISNRSTKKLVATFLFWAVIFTANAQTFSVAGKVTDNQKKPLVGASVVVKKLKKGTITGIQGKFQFQLPKGIYTIQVSFLGYKTVEKRVNINKNQMLNFILQEDANLLDEVLVSAVRVHSESPVTHSNLTKKAIAKRNLGQDIPQLVNYLPSVVSSSDAGAGVGYTYMSVRGSDASRINVTINGIPYNDTESQGTFWVNLGDFASSTESLQLQRGVGTSTNGAGAFGASLNILTDAVSENPYAEISNSGGSYNTRKHTVKFSTGKLFLESDKSENSRIDQSRSSSADRGRSSSAERSRSIEVSGRISNIYSDGYIDRAYTDLKSYFLQASYIDDNTLIKAITFSGKAKTYQAWFGIDAAQLAADRRQNPYTYENEIDNYKQDHYQLHWNEKLNENWSTNIGLNYTKGAGYFEQFKERENAADFNNLIVDNSDVIVRRWLDNDFYVANFNASYISEKLDVISGISYSNYTNYHFGEVIWGSDLAPNTTIRDHYYDSDAAKTDFSIFSKVTIAFSKKVKGYVDVQGRFINYKTDGLTSKRNPIDVDENYRFFNPKFGLTYRINNQNQLYASFAVANKEPKREDFKNGINTYESLNDIELGWRLKKEKIKINSTIYYMNYKNQLVLTGAINDVGSPIRETIGKSYRLGLEIDADIIFSEQLSMKPNIAISKNRNRDLYASLNGVLQLVGNTAISFSPDVVFGNIFTYTPTQYFQLSFLSKYVGKQFMSNLNSTVSKQDVLKGFFTSDVNIVYQIDTKSIFTSVIFTALINNVFNKEYVDRGYYYTYNDTWSTPGVTTTVDGAGYYPQATRNFLLGVTLKF